MNITMTARFHCLAALLLTTGFPDAAQNHFTDAEADGTKTFLRDNFHQTNVCMVIGLTDQRGNRIFTAGKLENGTTAEVNGDTIFEIGSITKTFTHLAMVDGPSWAFWMFVCLTY